MSENNSTSIGFWARVRRKLRALYRRHIRRNLWRLMGGRRVRVFGRDMSFDADSLIFEYPHTRVPEAALLDDIVPYTDYVQLRALVREAELLPAGATVMDVGAFHGIYAVLLGKILQGKGGRLIALEPNPLEFEVMRSNVRLNGLDSVVECINKAVADEPGQAFLSKSGNQSTLVQGGERADMPVEVTTVEKLLEDLAIAHLDLLIIDVEGAELPVLRGVPWHSQRPRIFCEMHPFAWSGFGYTGRDLGAYIRQRNYRCFDMYFQEHTDFPEELFYIGPTCMVSDPPLPEDGTP